MRYLVTTLVFLLTVSFTAQETITYPYNPDVDSDTYVGIIDLIELLALYGTTFETGEIMVNDMTFEAYLNELYMLIEAAALPDGTSDGQFLKWNGSEWVLVLPSVGCIDAEACNYDETANVYDEDKCIYEDACGVCDGPGEIYECGCSDTPEGDCDCDGNQVDALNVCGGECAADEDGDGICDDGDSCIGEADECGVCNGPGAIYDCGCTEPAPDTCDCEGNVVDAVGECGGGCQEDADEDGICDNQDDCVGEFDDCGVCNGPGPILGCGCENIPEGDCDCQGNQLDAVGTCGGACQIDINGDGVCDDDSIPGCTYDAACNYDPSASINDGSCDFTSCYGCTDIAACNYSAVAYFDNQSCTYPAFAYNCDSTCINDTDGDGYCDELEGPGCTDIDACNYDSGATELDDSCTYPGCTDSTFCNFNSEAGCDDGSCEDGYFACMDSEACNYDSEAVCGGIECVYPGCVYEQANNYDPLAGCDDGSCIIEGCNVDLACNFDPMANLDDGSCEFGNCPGCNDPSDYNYNPTSTNDELCGLATLFTNCGQEGRFGPSIEQVNLEYGAGSGIAVIDGIQQWTVPESGTYRIDAFGAQGGGGQVYTGGLGAMMGGYVSVTVGETLRILVGQQGYFADGASGGGGGSFVTDLYNNPLVIAGGGSGATSSGSGLNGEAGNDGGEGEGCPGNGGTGGYGGGDAQNCGQGAGGGGGFYTDGASGNSWGWQYGYGYLNGGYGGISATNNAHGGYGGGAGTHSGNTGGGAGGGYSGGGAPYHDGGYSGGGGGSFLSEEATLSSAESGVNEGHGKVVITLIP